MDATRTTVALCMLLLAVASTMTPVCAASEAELLGVATSARSAAAHQLDPTQAILLRRWYSTVGPRRNDESFGELTTRAAKIHLGSPYRNAPQTAAPETLRVDLETFQCVSLIESTLALARCTWTNKRNEACFLHELEAFRYRNGTMNTYSSRLHYFTDWIDDNLKRQRLVLLTAELGGEPVQQPFFFMTTHATHYPALADPTVFQAIAHTESRLSGRQHRVINGEELIALKDALQDGDIVAVVGIKPGLMVTHVGFIDRGPDDVARILHASSFHQQIILTAEGVAEHISRHPARRGVIIARPASPKERLR
ncbi:MAG: N-acetylmuramoyl-L-alanine amidase-like domain-containing protein [Gammaproteobacteria bacterium]